jgi:hypothetical protein
MVRTMRLFRALLDGGRRCRLRYAITVAIAIAGACGPSTRYTLHPLYWKEHFSGRDLGSQTIALTPFLNDSGPMRAEAIAPEKEIAALHEERKDLDYTGVSAFENTVIRKFGPDTLEAVYGRLFKGSMVGLQTDTALWKSVGSDYLMVLKLVKGLSLNSIDGRTNRKFRIEGELWDCDSMEVVWRTSVDCRCSDPRENTAALFTNAVRRMVSALPTSLSGYGKKSW